MVCGVLIIVTVKPIRRVFFKALFQEEAKMGMRIAAMAMVLVLLMGGIAAGEGFASQEEAIGMLQEAAERYYETVRADPERIREMTFSETSLRFSGWEEPVTLQTLSIRMLDHEMRYTMEVIGEPDENGRYPLYICLHGGGGGDAETNDGQWLDMTEYYRPSVQSGIYVAPRGIEDTWNMHFMDEALPMYDRLIENMVVFMNADPSRVYLLGFSAGGDGVYGIAPRMADRFAAVNMSSGHPNGVSLINAGNLPFCIQVGIRDYYTEEAARCIQGAAFEEVFGAYQGQYSLPWPHEIFVHVPQGHNFSDNSSESQDDNYVLEDPAAYARRAKDENWLEDFLNISAELYGIADPMTLSYAGDEGLNAAIFELVTERYGMDVTNEEDTDAVLWVSQCTRAATAESLVWDLETRGAQRSVTSFYWLEADPSVHQGIIEASFDPETNTVTVTPSEEVNGDFSILINPFIMDPSQPVRFETPKGTFTVQIEKDEEMAYTLVSATGDPQLAGVARISYAELTDGEAE